MVFISVAAVLGKIVCADSDPELVKPRRENYVTHSREVRIANVEVRIHIPQGEEEQGVININFCVLAALC